MITVKCGYEGKESYKECSNCHANKPLSDFYTSKNKYDKYGVRDSCKSCWNKQAKIRHTKNRERDNINTYMYNVNLKRETIDKYSPSMMCQRCGFDDIRALSIDHIDNNGSTHRRNIGVLGGNAFYRWLKKQGYPQGYQVLCMNCQMIKQIEQNVRDYPERMAIWER